MQTSSSSASTAGVASFNVMRRKVVNRPAPLIMAASSNAASDRRNTDDSSRKPSGAQIMPSIEDHAPQAVHGEDRRIAAETDP